jgi:hypothetical protein
MMMTDLRTRFRGADRIPAPDLWEDIARREPQPVRSGITAPRRVAIAAFSLALAVAAITFVVHAISENAQPRPGSATPTSAPTATSSGLIAFGAGTGIYTMNPDGSGLTLLQGPGAVAYYDPQWSPDGTSIAFYGYPRGGGSGYGGGADYDVLVMNADGSDLTNLTTSPADVRSGFSQMIPVWSPDGTQIAYDGDDGLYVMNADGSNQARIASGQNPPGRRTEPGSPSRGRAGRSGPWSPTGVGWLKSPAGPGSMGPPSTRPTAPGSPTTTARAAIGRST